MAHDMKKSHSICNKGLECDSPSLTDGIFVTGICDEDT